MIKRGSVLRGPCVIKLGNQTIRTQGDVQVSIGLDTFEIMTSEFGRVDQRRNNVPIELTFQPVGEVNAAMIPIYWPHLALPIGASLFGETDVPCRIVPVTGKEVIELKAAAITSMPDIIISATKTSIGSITITGLLANEKSWDNAEARFKLIPSEAAPVLSAIDVANIPTMPARIQWGAGYTDLKSAEGVTVSFNMETNNEESDEDGIYDVTLGNISASAKLTPLNTTVIELIGRMGLQNTGNIRGTSTSGYDLAVRASRVGGLKVTIPSARLSNLPLVYGMSNRRISELSFDGFRTTGPAATIGLVVEADITP